MIRLFTILFISLLLFGLKPVFSQSVVINEFCSLNRDLIDEDNDTPDWFELLNTGIDNIDLTNYAISDDSSDMQKWIFPAVNLPPGQALLVFASGKDRKEIMYYRNFVTQGDTFSYVIGSADVPSDWRNPEFNDSAWALGPSGFGYGDNDDSTLIPEGTISVFVRKTIQITNVDKIQELILHIDYDDGFVAYLNGTEVARANLGTPNTDVPYNQTADNYVEPLMVNGQPPEAFEISNFKDILKEGANVLAIQVHNNTSTSSDITLIPFLSAGYNSPVEGNPVPEVLKLEDKALHTNFKLASDGEKIYLSDNNGNLIDQTDSVPLPLGVSYGRKADSLSCWAYYADPTPGVINSTHAFDSLGSGTIAFSPVGGIFDTIQQVLLSAGDSAKIYFTTDGSVPTESSYLYTSPIIIDSSTVIRAAVLNSDVLALTPSVETYIIEKRDFTLPIVSLSTDPFNLFDWNYGIYELGPNAETADPNFGANFWEDWERPIYIEYMDKDGKKLFSAPGGVKIFGAWSRAHPQKSLALFARSTYGVKSFKYPFFAERDNKKYKSLVLRNSGNDWNSTVMRDGLMTGLVNDGELDRQAFQPTIVYINGEYWGIQNLREKVNEDFLADNHPGVDPDKVDLLQMDGEVLAGSDVNYRHMMSYMRMHTMATDGNYDSVCTMMDVVDFMEYEIAEIYYDNTDWPGNNIKYWREQTNYGKWRWILYDTDFGFGIYGSGNYNNNTLDFAMEPNGPSWPNPPWSTLLLRNLVENEHFKHDFINRFADRINYEFNPVKVTHFIDSLKNNIQAEIPYHIDRWQHIGNFSGNVNVLKNFAAKRPDKMRGFINDRFSLGGVVQISLDVSDETQGSIRINSLSLNKFPWKGKYFNNNPVTVVAIPKPGYEFSHWEGYDSDAPDLWLNIPVGGIALKAVFKESTRQYNCIVINEINYKSATDYDSGDWIELYNTTGADIDLSKWILKDSNDSNQYVFEPGVVISHRGYLVVCRDLEKFHAIYTGVKNAIGDLGFGLSSNNDMVRLYTNNGMLMDSVSYSSVSPWPEINDDQTISLVTPLCDNTLPISWEGSTGRGTPGKNNDYFISVPEKKVGELLLEASCFPNPAGNNATVRWTCNRNEIVSINVYNTQGIKVVQVFNGNCPTGTFEEPVFKGVIQPGGIYFIQVSFGNGLTKTLKLVKL